VTRLTAATSPCLLQTQNDPPPSRARAHARGLVVIGREPGDAEPTGTHYGGQAVLTKRWSRALSGHDTPATKDEPCEAEAGSRWSLAIRTTLVGRADACHIAVMSTERTYPYSLEISPCERPAGHFQWVIRKHGKLIQRSDRLHPSEGQARKNGQSELERLFLSSRDGR